MDKCPRCGHRVGQDGIFVRCFNCGWLKDTHRSEVMNPPASAALGAEAGNLNTEQRHGTGAVPRAAEVRPTDVAPPPLREFMARTIDFCDCDPQPIPDEENDFMCSACGMPIDVDSQSDANAESAIHPSQRKP